MMSNKEFGIGNLLASGLTLKQHRDAIIERTQSQRLLQRAGKLALRDSDPIGYEKLFSKLRGGLVHARETAKKIAASPIVEQEGELCFTLQRMPATACSPPPASSSTSAPWARRSST
jgi:acetone carboxylase alpha subunit